MSSKDQLGPANLDGLWKTSQVPTGNKDQTGGMVTKIMRPLSLTNFMGGCHSTCVSDCVTNILSKWKQREETSTSWLQPLSSPPITYHHHGGKTAISNPSQDA